MRHSRRFVFCIALLAPAGACWAGVASITEKWPAGELKACFFEGAAEVRAQVAGLAADWTRGTSIGVDFGPAPGYRDCEPRDRSQIRIAFQEGRGFWSYLGTQSRSVPAGEPTLNLDGLSRSIPQAMRHQVLHQFGHAFGLMHQEETPAWKCASEVNPQGAARQVGSTQEAIDRKAKYAIRDDPRFLVTEDDVASVMRLLHSPEDFQRGVHSPCYAPPAQEASRGDRQVLARLYPPRPADVSAESRHQSISIVLDGAMSQENYQYLVMDLRRKGMVGLKQHIDAKGETIGEILAKEGLLPSAAVTKDFERFLCGENRHICSRSTGSAVWTNRAAATYTPEPNTECGSPHLGKSVICLPNVRVESQRVFVESRYEPKTMTLSDLVVGRTKGCDEWNDECKRIVSLSNPKLPAKYLATRFFDAGPIDLTVPARTFRIPLEFNSKEERDKIGRLVEDFKRGRARALRVSSDEIAIRLVEPVGNPRAQQADTLLREPEQGYAQQLLSMQYPFTSVANAPDFLRIHPVDVALWDNRIDTEHCEFKRDPQSIVQKLHPTRPPLDPPPEAAGDCAVMRPPGRPPVARWDHGTHVAGIIFAQVNGKGIAGVNPKVRLWSWEVVDGDQFNTADDPFIELLGKHGMAPVVVNISQTFPRATGSTPLRLMILGEEPPPNQPPRYRGMSQTRVVVAAAGVGAGPSGGPEGLRIDEAQQCDFYPACWSNGTRRPNSIISVVGLDAKGGGVLRGKAGDAPDAQEHYLSNYGQAFDVAAVGEVTSTLHGNWIGTMKGSSFAAPYVTGLASLLIGKARAAGLEAKISRVKERILATADRHTPELRASSRFGRIHFARALDFEQDVITFKPSVAGCTTNCTTRGRVTRFASTSILFKYSPDGGASTEKAVTLQHIRRLIADEAGTMTIIHDDGGKLSILENASPVYPDTTITFNGNPIQLRSIADFVACSFAECDNR